jgi:putative zinc finger/helix-turn-helix YgiT family protein
MSKLTDPTVIKFYLKALSNYRYEGYVAFTETAWNWVRREMPGWTQRRFAEMLFKHVDGGGDIDQVKEAREPWVDSFAYHYDLRLVIPVRPRRLYVETRMIPELPGLATIPTFTLLAFMMNERRAITGSKTKKTVERPFPWICPRCLQKEVRPAVKSYNAKVKHDGVEYDLSIPRLELPTCGNCGEELSTNSVDEQVNDALRERLHLLTPRQIRAARRALGLRQYELARRLRIAPATISRWETGSLIQSGAMDNYLRIYFAIPEVRNALSGDAQDPALGTHALSP